MTEHRLYGRTKFTHLSPSKINLGLAVVGRDPSGYHLLESLFWPIDFADTLTVQKKGIRDSVQFCWAEDAPFTSALPNLETSTVAITMEWLRKRGYVSENYSITISKKIPIGAGLGGGSSNAGTLFKLFARDSTLSPQRIAQEVGADVPFFTNPLPAWVSGVGEQIKPIPVGSLVKKRLHVLLLLLPISCSTSAVFSIYRNRSNSFSFSAQPPSHLSTLEGLFSFLKGKRNDLESSAIQVAPLIREGLQELQSLDAPFVGLSGTGSTCVALFDTLQSANHAAKALAPFCRKHNCKSVIAKTFDAV